jgi:sulfite reductase alpha subunit-like flavoprotein
VTAFSREQKEKVYVQHRLQERSEELYNNYLKKKGCSLYLIYFSFHSHFLESGVIYVCGDATQMAKDVMKAIKQIYEKYEGKTEKEAENIVAEMRKNHRYQEDVWHSY